MNKNKPKQPIQTKPTREKYCSQRRAAKQARDFIKA
jgi:hypothetical protein